VKTGDHVQLLKEAIIAQLRADGALIAAVGTRIYGEMPPDPVQWPFIRYGMPTTTVYRTSEWGSRAHSVVLHAFAKGRGSREINFLNQLIYNALDESNPIISAEIAAIQLTFVSSQVILDTAETGAYHGIMNFDAITSEVAQV
jgi:hypothetical protein